MKKKVLENKLIIFIDQLLFRINDDMVLPTAAQLTYFIILSIFPFIVVLLNILSYTSLVQGEMFLSLIRYLPFEIQEILLGFIYEIMKTRSQGLLSFAAIAGIWTASSGVKAVIRAINKAYDYKETRSFFKLKFISIIFTLALLFMMVMVFLTLIFGDILSKQLYSFFWNMELVLKFWALFRTFIPFIYMIITFGLLYKYSPCTTNRKEIRFLETLPGAVFTTLGWIIISFLFSYYVNNFGKYTITYGSLGGAIILLVWLYLSSIIIVLGGEINATIKFFQNYDFKIHPNKSLIWGFMNKKKR